MPHPLLFVVAAGPVLPRWQQRPIQHSHRVSTRASGNSSQASYQGPPYEVWAKPAKPRAEPRKPNTARRVARTDARPRSRVPVILQDGLLSIREGATDVGDDEPKFNASLICRSVYFRYGLGIFAVYLGTALGLPDMPLGRGGCLALGPLLLGIFSAIPLHIMGQMLVMWQYKFQVFDTIVRERHKTALQMFGARRAVYRTFWYSGVVGTAAAVGEEIALRGILATLVAMKLNAWLGSWSCTLALWIAAALSGAMNLKTPLYAMSLSAAGAYYGWLQFETGNIVVPMICHATYRTFRTFVDHLLVTQMPRELRRDLVKDTEVHKPRRRWFADLVKRIGFKGGLGKGGIDDALGLKRNASLGFNASSQGLNTLPNERSTSSAVLVSLLVMASGTTALAVLSLRCKGSTTRAVEPLLKIA